MKKIILMLFSFLLLPITLLANETKEEKLNDSIDISMEENFIKYDNITEDIIYENKKLSDRLFMEYYFNFFSTIETDIEGFDEVRETNLNSSVYPSLVLGFESDKFRFSFNPTFIIKEDEEEIFSYKFRFDYVANSRNFRPYLGLIASFNYIDIEYADIQDNAFGYGAGFGVLYDISDNIFVNIGVNYTRVKFDIDVDYGYDISIKLSGVGLNAGFGFRF